MGLPHPGEPHLRLGGEGDGAVLEEGDQGPGVGVGLDVAALGDEDVPALAGVPLKNANRLLVNQDGAVDDLQGGLLEVGSGDDVVADAPRDDHRQEAEGDEGEPQDDPGHQFGVAPHG